MRYTTAFTQKVSLGFSPYMGMQVSAEVMNFSHTKVEALNLRKSLQTEDNLIDVLRHCFLSQGRTEPECNNGESC